VRADRVVPDVAPGYREREPRDDLGGHRPGARPRRCLHRMARLDRRPDLLARQPAPALDPVGTRDPGRLLVLRGAGLPPDVTAQTPGFSTMSNTISTTSTLSILEITNSLRISAGASGASVPSASYIFFS